MSTYFNKQRLIACAAAILMLAIIGMIIPWSAQASAPAPSSGDVAQRIEQLRQRFPDGSFFTVSGQSCYHGSNGSCYNCSLHGVMRRLGYSHFDYLRQSWTCVAFARYAFWWIFGVSHNVYAYRNEVPRGTIRINRYDARPGDLFIWNGQNFYPPSASAQHMAIYLGNGWFFDSNSGGAGATANITYGTRLTSLGTPSMVLRAYNYDEVDSGISRRLPVYEAYGPYGDYSPFAHLGSIIGRFTIPNPVGTVYVALRYGSQDGEIVATRAIEIHEADAEFPITVGFLDFEPGTYSLIFTQPGHTSFTINNVVIPEDGGILHLHQDYRFPDQLPIYPGDITGSGQVDDDDLALLMENWASDYESANFTSSGQINIQELNQLLANWMMESVVVE